MVNNDKVIAFLKEKTDSLPVNSEEWEIYRIALRAMRVVNAIEKQKKKEMDDGK